MEIEFGLFSLLLDLFGIVALFKSFHSEYLVWKYKVSKAGFEWKGPPCEYNKLKESNMILDSCTYFVTECNGNKTPKCGCEFSAPIRATYE